MTTSLSCLQPPRTGSREERSGGLCKLRSAGGLDGQLLGLIPALAFWEKTVQMPSSCRAGGLGGYQHCLFWVAKAGWRLRAHPSTSYSMQLNGYFRGAESAAARRHSDLVLCLEGQHICSHLPILYLHLTFPSRSSGQRTGGLFCFALLVWAEGEWLKFMPRALHMSKGFKLMSVWSRPLGSSGGPGKPWPPLGP